MAMRTLAMTLTLLAGGAALGAEPLHLEESAAAWSASLDFSAEAARIEPLDAALRAEARRALDAFKAEAASNSDASRPFQFALTDRAAYVSDRYVSVVRAVESWTGGAHGARSVEALTWDAGRDAVVLLDDLLTPRGMEAVSAALREAIVSEVHGGEVTPFWREAVDAATVAAAMKLANFTLVPGRDGAAGLDFHFNPYDVAPWSAGAPVVRIDRGVFAGMLTSRGAALFGG